MFAYGRPARSPSGGALYSHTTAKLVFVRLFRHSRYVYAHTALGWGAWAALCLLATAAAFALASAVPIFAYLTGVAGFFWLHDACRLGPGGARATLRRRWPGAVLSTLTVLAGTFMCVAGTYVSIKVCLSFCWRSGRSGR